MGPTRIPKCRSDGWTAERQLRFLDALVTSRSVAHAAQVAGMSRESAYRLRGRRDGALFAALWDRALAFRPPPVEVHTRPRSDGLLMRLMGNHFRRKAGVFALVSKASAETRGT